MLKSKIEIKSFFNLNLYGNMYSIIFLIISCLILLYSNSNYSSHNDNINKLVRQTARWATAAGQDSNPYINNLHATYAVGYLMALRELYTDQQINNAANTDIRELDKQVNKKMDDAVQLLIDICPQGQPKDVYLAFLAKEGRVFK